MNALAPEEATVPRGREDWVCSGAVVMVWLLALVVVNVVPYLPTHDGPQHIYLGHVINRFSDPGAIYPLYFRPTQPLSALGFPLLFCPLDDLFGWKVALRISLSIIVTIWGGSLWALARALSPQRGVVGITAFAIAFQWSFYMGFFSWMISMSLGLFTLAIAVRGMPWNTGRRILIAVLLCVHAMVHPFPALVTSFVLVALVLFHHSLRSWLKELAVLAVMGMPVVLVVAYAAGWLGGHAVDLPTGAPVPPTEPWLQAMLRPLNLFVGGPIWRSLPVTIVALAGTVWGAWRWKEARFSRRDRAFWLVGAVLVVIFLVAPLHLATWEFFSPRFLAPATALLLVVLPFETLSRTVRYAALVVACLHAVASLIWSGWFHRDMYARTADVLAAANQPVQRFGPRLPVILDTQAGYARAIERWYPYFEPTLNIGTLFAIEQGGVVPYTFTSVPQLHGLVLTEEGLARMPPAPHRQVFGAAFNAATKNGDQGTIFATLTNFASFGAQYEDVILYASHDEHLVFLERGYRLDAHEGKARILRFEGCPVHVAVSAAGPLLHSISLEYGWHPVTRHSFTLEAPAGTQPEDGEISFALDRAPCGWIWLRAWLDQDNSGTLSPADRVCVGADEEGRLRAKLGPGVERLECTLLD
jgi:hypothetical protein